MEEISKYFARAIELGELGRGKTSPNPFVGAVIFKENMIVGEGYTQPWGYDHAEVQALKQAGKNAHDAEMVVTLEPCCSYGKTPPCTNAIIKAGIKKVYIGIIDPNPKVNGKGIKILKEAGIEVELGFEQKEITRQLEYYLTWITQKRPFVFLKTAMTLDGYIAGADGKSKWITGKESREFVHKLREEADAIVTGIGTVLADDPQLNCRLPKPAKQPVRIIIDRNLRIPLDSKLVCSAKDQETVVFYQKSDLHKIKELTSYGVKTVQIQRESHVIAQILNYLKNIDKYCIMVEAGNKLTSEFIKEKIVDKYYTFLAPAILGNGLKAISLTDNHSLNQKLVLEFEEIKQIGKDLLVISYPEL